MIVLSDSGPLIALSKIKHLDILRKFFDKIIIPQAVWTEVVEKGAGRPGSKELNAGIVLIDDRIAREIARSMDLKVAGTLFNYP